MGVLGLLVMVEVEEGLVEVSGLVVCHPKEDCRCVINRIMTIEINDSLDMILIYQQVDDILMVVWIHHYSLHQNILLRIVWVNFKYATFNEYLCAIKWSSGVFPNRHLSGVAILI